MFDVVKGRPVIRPDALTVPEMRAIWDSDKSKDKAIADKKLCYIYHIVNPASPYARMGEERKRAEVTRAFLTPSKLEEDEAIKIAIEAYKDTLYTSANRWLEAVEEQLDKLAIYIKNATPGKNDKADANILKIMDKGKQMLVTYTELVKLVNEQQNSSGNIAKNVKPNMFDDG